MLSDKTKKQIKDLTYKEIVTGVFCSDTPPSELSLTLDRNLLPLYERQLLLCMKC